MKAIVIFAGIVVLAASVFADYKWRRWMAARKREHEADQNRRA